MHPRLKTERSILIPLQDIDLDEPTEYLCGQSVIAMLPGVSVDEVVHVMQNDKGTSTSELCGALNWYGLKTTTKARLKYTKETKLPEQAKLRYYWEVIC